MADLQPHCSTPDRPTLSLREPILLTYVFIFTEKRLRWRSPELRTGNPGSATVHWLESRTSKTKINVVIGQINKVRSTISQLETNVRA